MHVSDLCAGNSIMHGICMKYAWYMHGIHQCYAWNMPVSCMELCMKHA